MSPIAVDPSTFTEVVSLEILVNDVDLTDDVRWTDAVFIATVNGVPSPCQFAVKDLGHSRSFVTGQTIELRLDGDLWWSGFLTKIRRQYSFAVDNTEDPQATSRWFLLEGIDVNVLLTKRVVYNKLNPARLLELPPKPGYVDPKHSGQWQAETPSDVMVKHIIANDTDLPDDGVSTVGVQNVGSPNPDFGAAVSGSVSVADFMRDTNRLLSGIFYLTPDRVLVHRGVEVATTPYMLSDTPAGEAYDIGPREYSITSDASAMVNDALVWGTAAGVATPDGGAHAFSRTEDTDGQDLHGRWQIGEFNTSIYKQTSLDHRSESMVYGNTDGKFGASLDRIVCTATVFRPIFRLGDVVLCKQLVFDGTPEPPLDYMGPYVAIALPVRRMAITFPTNRAARFDLVLTQEIDDPWSIYEWVFPRIDTGIKIDLPPPGPPVCTDADITDSFDRANTTEGAGGGIADCGYSWTPGNTLGLANPVSQIDTNQLETYAPGGDSDGGVTSLIGTLPFPVTGSIHRAAGGTAASNGAMTLLNETETDLMGFFWDYGYPDFTLRLTLFTLAPYSPATSSYDEVLIGEIVGAWDINFEVTATSVSVEFVGYGTATVTTAAASPTAIDDLTGARDFSIGTNFGGYAKYDNLNISGLNRCGNTFGITDTFNRANGSPGTADCGLIWVSPGHLGSVDGEINTNTLYMEAVSDNQVGGWYLEGPAPFPLYGSVEVRALVAPVSGAIRLSAGVTTVWAVWKLTPYGGTDFSLTLDDGTNTVTDTASLSPSAPFLLYFKIEADSVRITGPGGFVEVAVASATPSAIGTLTAAADFELGLDTGGGGFVRYDNLDIIGLASVNAGLAGLPTSGGAGQTIEHSGGSTFFIGTPYAEGSLEVYVNGALLSPFSDYTQDGVAMTITLATPITAGDTLRIYYQANGAR